MVIAASRLLALLVACAPLATVSAQGTPPQTAIADCEPTLVGTMASRVHVRCGTAVSGSILFFAVRTSDSAFAERFLEVATSALIGKRILVLQYDPNDTSGTSWGCPIVECRPALGISVR
jgi:hypothetical protein